MQSAITRFLGDHCSQEFIIRRNVFDVPCLKLLISKLLSAAIILGSVFLKVPQIVKIVNEGKAERISLVMLLLELTNMLFSMTYSIRQGYEFSVYGETAFISLQNVVIVALLYHYEKRASSELFAILSIYAISLYCFLLNPGDVISFQIVSFLYSLNIPIFVASRVPQIWTNFSYKSTGQLALLTWLLNFGGSMARVFTTVQETSDNLMLAGYVLGVLLNGTILLQILLYSAQKPKKS